MGFEKPEPIPENNELPLNISESEPLSHQGRESAIWKIKAQDQKGQERLLALKQVRKDEFATEAEMKKSREFYNFLKQNPNFGRFISDTLYFKARETAGGEPHAYRLQKALEGKRVDELSDEELYGNEAVVKQLLEFIDAAIDIFKEAQEAKRHTPDLYGDKLLANYLFNPRYSSNIIITDKPNERGQRVFFVDVNPQVQQAEGIGKEFQKRIGSKLQVAQLNRWKKEVENRLSSVSKKSAT